MRFFEALILGLVQGATEFIPISSSGHLVLVPWLLGWPEPGLAFSALLHWGTLLAVLIAFRREVGNLIWAALHALRDRSLADPQARIACWIVLASIPAAIVGLLLKDFFETLFSTPRAVALFLLMTSLILWFGERYGAQLKTAAKMRWADAVLVGLAQAGAIAPGISRSGATISAAMLLGVTRVEAARFSFLLMIPATLGAGILSLIDLTQSGVLGEDWLPLTIGFLASTLSGILAIRWLLTYLARRSLATFAVYCAMVGFGGLILSTFRG
jgi:undecaprenyl-diphosphatase